MPHALFTLASADLAGLLGLAGGINRFRNRAVSFLRLRLFDALFGDSELNREQRLYLAWNTIVFGWLLLIIIGAGDVFNAGLQLIGTVNDGSDGISPLVALGALLVIPCLISLLLGTLSILYLFIGWLVNSPPFQNPTLSATIYTLTSGIWLGIVLVARQTGHVGGRSRELLLYVAALVILFASAALSRKVPAALKGGKQALRLRIAQIATIVIAVMILVAATIPNLLSAVAWTSIVILACWALFSFASGLSFFSVLGGRLMITELMSLLGAALCIASALAVIGILPSADAPAALFAGAALFAIGVATSARGTIFWPEASTDRLPITASDATRTTVPQEVGSHVISRAAAEMRLAFGNAFTKRIAAAGNSVPINLDSPAEQLGNDPRSYGEALKTMGQAISSQLGPKATQQVFSRALNSVHWRGRLVLHKEILPNTPWSGFFDDEASIRDGERSARLEKILLFQDLSNAQRQEVADRLVAEKIAPGRPLVQQGDIADRCYLIIEGEVQVEETDAGGETQILSYLTSEDFFGESALLEHSRRTATVRAITSTLVLSWSKADFADLAKESPETANSLMRQLKYMQVLLRIPLFADLPKSALRNLLPRLRSEKFETATDVIRQGEPGTKFYLIQRGKVKVVKRAGDQDVPLCELANGDYFGEIALLQDQPRSATIHTLEPTTLLVLEKSDFLRLTTASDLFATNLSTISRDRLGGHESK